jgi:predicted dehydrogenase
VSVVLSYPQGVQATLSTTLWSRTPTRAHISGTEGHIQVEGSFYAPTSFTLTRNDGARWTFERPAKMGLQYEAAEVARCVAAGRTESERMTWDGTLDVMRTMDEVRRQIGLSYPGE